MEWLFLLFGIVFLALAVGYYLNGVIRQITDSCYELIEYFVKDLFFEYIRPPVLLVILSGIFFLLFYFLLNTVPPLGNTNERTVESPSEPIKYIQFQVVAARNNEPIEQANVMIKRHSYYSQKDGVIKIPKNILDSDSILQVTHERYIAQYFNTTDLLRYINKIALQEKYRLIVVEFECSDAGTKQEITQSTLQNLRRNMESQLASCSEIDLLAESLRDRIIKELFRVRENKSLYDKTTLSKIGDFLGATHGVFGEVREKDLGMFELKAHFIDLEKALIVNSCSIYIEGLDFLDDASIYLADKLLVKFTQVEILKPYDGTQSLRVASLEGYVLFRPRYWQLWLSVIPKGNYLHYPQRPITIDNNGRWIASNVSLGDDQTLLPADFYIKPVLVDSKVNSEIIKYFKGIVSDQNSNVGIDLTEWERQRKCYVFEGVELQRVK